MNTTRTLSLGLLLLTVACQAPGSGQDDRSPQTDSGPAAILFATIGGIT